MQQESGQSFRYSLENFNQTRDKRNNFNNSIKIIMAEKEITSSATYKKKLTRSPGMPGNRARSSSL
jgi:hypothetical protein